MKTIGHMVSTSMRRLILASRWLAFTWVLIVLSWPVGSPLLAQGTSGIQGQITDNSGASVPNAYIKATNDDTGVSRSAKSGDTGFYRILDLLPGNYQVRVELAGFKTFVQRGLKLNSDSIANFNFTLQIGEVTQTIEVTAEEPQIDTTVARVSEVLSEKEIRALPVQGRGVYYLATMSPGVIGKPESDFYCCDAFSSFKGISISSGGSSEFKSNYTLDGLTLRYSSGSYWGGLFAPNVDAVSEIRVSTQPYLAEVGTISGPQVQMVTKGGTNNWHGTAHFSDIEGTLNAKPFFNETKPDRYTRYFGGTVGGAIIKNRLFVFGGYQGLREQSAQSSVYVAETQAYRDFVVSNNPNSIAAQILQAFPPARYPSTSLPGNPFLGQVSVDDPGTRSGEQFNLRVDYQSASAKDRLYGTFWSTHKLLFNPALRKDFAVKDDTDSNSVNVVHTHSFSPQTLSEFRFGYTNFLFNYGQDPATNSTPGMATDDGLSIGNFGWTDTYNPIKTYEVAGNFSVIRGRHTFKFGGGYHRVAAVDEFFAPADIPIYQFASVNDYANDNPYIENRNLEVADGKAHHTNNHTFLQVISFFAQDTWQVKPNLTVNYGVRWEDFVPLWYDQGLENWQPVVTMDQLTPSSIATLKSVKVDSLYNNQLTNFGPRLGVAWDPTGHGKMSIRAGIGLLYDEVPVGPIYNHLYQNPPGVFSVSAGPQYGIPIVYGLAPPGTTDFPPNPNFAAPKVDEFGGIEGSRAALGGIVNNFQIPRILDMFVGGQYELTNDLKLEVNYRYKRVSNELYATDVNRFTGDLLDNVLDRFNPHFDLINLSTNWGRRSYHGIILSATKRFSQGWYLSASYTYSHAMDNLNGLDSLNTGQNVTDWTNRDLEFARDDIPHVFSLHNIWELPILRGKTGALATAFGGWQLNSIWNFQGGNIFTPISFAGYGQGGDFNADGQRGDRPDRPTGDVATSFSKQQWLDGVMNPAIFPLPDLASPRAGTLPRDFFRGPGYARVDLALSKEFPMQFTKLEGARLQIRVDAFNLLNRLNISTVSSQITAADFGRATAAYQNRTLQFGVKFLF